MPRTRQTQSQIEPVISDTLTTPPGSESHGDRYIIAGTGGAWSGFTIGDVVTVVDTGPTVWQSFTPEEGDEVYIKALDKYKTWDGSSWNLEGASTLEQLTDVSGASPTKGNILAANGTNWAPVPIGTEGQVPVARAAAARGFQWETLAGASSGPLDAARFSLNGTTGSFGSTPVTLPFNRTDLSNSIATNSSGEITINSTGTYLITADITTDELTGNNRTEFASFLELDTGSGFAEVDGTQRRHYSRNNAQGAQSASINIALSLTSGDVIRIRSYQNSGGDTGQWIDDGSSISIVNLEGVEGPQGPPGSGSVDSVNGQTGVVVLDADDIAETASRVWFTPAEESKLAGIEANAKDDQDADEVPFDNSGSDLTSTDTEAAIKEVNTKVRRQPDIVLMQVFT